MKDSTNNNTDGRQPNLNGADKRTLKRLRTDETNDDSPRAQFSNELSKKIKNYLSTNSARNLMNTFSTFEAKQASHFNEMRELTDRFDKLEKRSVQLLTLFEQSREQAVNRPKAVTLSGLKMDSARNDSASSAPVAPAEKDQSSAVKTNTIETKADIVKNATKRTGPIIVQSVEDCKSIPIAPVPPAPDLPCTKATLPIQPALQLTALVSNNVFELHWDLKGNRGGLYQPAERYEIYQYNSITVTWEQLASSSVWVSMGEVIASRLPMKCDLSLNSGTAVYYFIIRSVDSFGRRSNWSNVATYFHN